MGSHKAIMCGRSPSRSLAFLKWIIAIPEKMCVTDRQVETEN